MISPIGHECVKLQKACYSPSMHTDKEGWPYQPPQTCITVCNVLGYYPDPGDCRACLAARNKEKTTNENQ